ncbi:MAG: response regulator [Treponema sp.]|jgi:signal transduction histidine kinase/DNA-binding response OmpR family regulator|nr:response regulator [Treponema sp.]
MITICGKRGKITQLRTGRKGFRVPIILFLVFAVFPAFAETKTAPFSINLQDYPLYLKQGFSVDDTLNPNLQDGSWLIKQRFAQVLIMKAGLPGLPKRVFLSPFGREVGEFTFIIPFSVHDATAIGEQGFPVPGLFLSGIGDNWEIYLNGKMVRSEMRRDGQGRILEHHSRRKVFFPLDRTLFRTGENILAFRIVGDPTDQTVGFQYSAPFYIADYDRIAVKNNEALSLILIGGYILVGVYHLFLFLSRRRDTYNRVVRKHQFSGQQPLKNACFAAGRRETARTVREPTGFSNKSNIYCGLFSLLMGFYFFFRTWSIYLLIPDTLIVVKLEFFCIFLVIPALGLFIEKLCLGKTTAVTKIYSGIFGFLAVTQLLLPHPYGSDALIVWQVLGIGSLLYILIRNIIMVFIQDMRKAKPEGRRFFRTLRNTYSGNMLIGVVIVVISAVTDILDSLFFHYSLSVIQYSFFFFCMATIIMLTRIYGNLNTKLQETNETLDQGLNALKKATDASQTKNIFLANMSHEIRAPMNAILGMAELILQESPGQAIQEKTESIKSAGSSLLAIINDILDFSKIEAGKLDIVKQEYCFSSLINDVINIISIRLNAKEKTGIPGEGSRGDSGPIEFITHIDPSIPDMLIGDEVRIRQILINLLVNAVKYTHRGKITFSAIRQSMSAESITLSFKVADTGIGIKAEDTGRLFTGFTQFDSHRKQDAESTGLGLAISRNLCLLMDGDIRFESEYEKGSVFTVVLPQGLRHRTASDTDGENREKDGGFSIFAAPEARTLIVDDLENNLVVAAGLLAPYGMRIDTVLSGKEALERVKQNHYDLIFMDHMMDGMDGVETVWAIRAFEEERRKEKGKVPTDIPIVALTANVVLGMREFFLERGFNDFLPKPIELRKLHEICERWIPEEKKVYDKVYDKVYETGRPSAAGEKREKLKNTALFELDREIKLDLLKHYVRHFQNHAPADRVYLDRFSGLIAALGDTVKEGAFAGEGSLAGRAGVLEEAGKRGDIPTIEKLLPDFYEDIKAAAVTEETPVAGFTEKLLVLKDALNRNDTELADQVIAELFILPLKGKEQKLFIALYDFLMAREIDKAKGMIESWLK